MLEKTANGEVHNLYSSPVYWLGNGLEYRALIPGRGREGIFPLRHRVQTGSGVYPARGKVAAA
jgi:hypothetical protein